MSGAKEACEKLLLAIQHREKLYQRVVVLDQQKIVFLASGRLGRSAALRAVVANTREVVALSKMLRMLVYHAMVL